MTINFPLGSTADYGKTVGDITCGLCIYYLSSNLMPNSKKFAGAIDQPHIKYTFNL